VESTLLKKVSSSTAAQIHKGQIRFNANTANIYGPLLFERIIMAGNIAVCKDEKFAEQLSPARCSGFLINEDTLVTAGHCMSSPSD
jgi:hypothetical protein